MDLMTRLILEDLRLAAADPLPVGELNKTLTRIMARIQK